MLAGMEPLPSVLWPLLATLCLGCGSGGQDPQPAKPVADQGAPTDRKDGTPSNFARFVRDGDGGRFDVAVTTYRNGDGVEVVLFGAVHIADGRHYEELQQRFATVEALLYELVGPEDYRPTKGEGGTGSVISLLQNALKTGLELEFQLDAVDYSPANFVHADMTPEEFEKSMAERGESLLGLMVRMSLQGMSQAGDRGDDDEGGERDEPRKAPPAVDLVAAFRSGEGRHQLRLLLASQLEQLERMAALGGEKGTTLLEGRNEKCLEVLQREIQNGRRRLGIYYGAAHLPHLEQRLVKDLGFRKVDHEWLLAWDCQKRSDPKFDRELWQARRKARSQIEAIAKAVRGFHEEHGTARVPTFAELGERWRGQPVDPWGREYRIVSYPEAPFFDVHSLGQDGIADTDDDLHSSTPVELRRMRRLGAARQHR